MADLTYNRVPETRPRWLAVAGIVAAAAGVFMALAARIRLTQPTVALPQQAASNFHSVTPEHLPARQPAGHSPERSPRRTALFLVFTLGLAALLIALQNSGTALAAPLFVLLLLGALGLAVAAAPPDVRRTILTPSLTIGALYRLLAAFVRSTIAFIWHYRLLWSSLSAGGALLMMIFSAYSFQVARWYRLPINEPVFFMLLGGGALGLSLFFARPNIALPALAATQARVLPRVNRWTTGVGVAVLLLLSEVNGKVFDVSRLYPVTTDAQFWLLVLGISMVVMGLAGWQPVFRLPPLKWPFLIVGVALVVLSEIGTALAASWLQEWAAALVNAILFVTVRLGNLLILWGVFSGGLKFSRPRWLRDRRSWLLVAAALLVGLVLVARYGTFVIDLGIWLAINTHFWFVMVAANLLRAPIAALYRHLSAEPSVAARSPDSLDVTSRLARASTVLHYAALAAIILLAIFARFHLLNDTMRFLVDEDSFIGATHYLRAVPTMELLAPFSSISAFPYVFPYWQLQVIQWLGRSFLGLRGASAILGVLAVPALYFLARTLFDRKTALLAALFMASLPPHLQFSRIGISEIAAPFFGTLAFAFLGRGFLHGRRWDYALGGAMLGLTHYFHEGGRLLYTPLAIAWVIACLLFAHRRPNSQPEAQDSQSPSGNWQPATRNIVVALLALVIVAAPIYYTLVGMNRPIFARMVDNNSGLGGKYWQTVFEPDNWQKHVDYHILPAFQVYVNQLDNTLFYADNNALILPVLVPLFLLGVFQAAWRWRAPGMLLALGWLLSTSLGNSLMVDSAGSPRYVMVFPALALTIAIGLRYTAPLIVRHAHRARLLLAVAGVALALFQVNYYFSEYLPGYNRHFRVHKASPDGYDAALRSVDFPAGTHIHVISQHLVNQIETVGLLGLIRENVYVDTLTPADFDDAYIGDLRCRVDHAFFIERTDFDTLNKLKALFYLRQPEFSPYDDLLPSQRLVLFYAPYIKGSEDIYGRKC